MPGTITSMHTLCLLLLLLLADAVPEGSARYAAWLREVVERYCSLVSSHAHLVSAACCCCCCSAGWL
jgi:hypothetical protein